MKQTDFQSSTKVLWVRPVSLDSFRLRAEDQEGGKGSKEGLFSKSLRMHVAGDCWRHRSACSASHPIFSAVVWHIPSSCEHDVYESFGAEVVLHKQNRFT